MSRAIWRLSLVSLFAVLAMVPSPAGSVETVKLIDGVGLIDYSNRPNFKVGTWAKYHMKGNSEAGLSDDYFSTILIAGEDCFWVETLTEDARGPRAVATLVSYAIFDDPNPTLNLQFFLRKFLDGLD